MSSTKNTYLLPFNKRDLIKAKSDPRVHFGYLRHAIDFILPEGTPIVAVKRGRVAYIYDKSRYGGADPKYQDPKYQNVISIQHSHGEISEYAHIQYRSSLLKVGDAVKQGQKIARCGNTGFSTCPHLHFHIARLTDKSRVGWETLKPRWKVKLSVDRSQPSVPKSMRKTLRALEKLKKDWLEDN